MNVSTGPNHIIDRLICSFIENSSRDDWSKEIRDIDHRCSIGRKCLSGLHWIIRWAELHTERLKKGWQIFRVLAVAIASFSRFTWASLHSSTVTDRCSRLLSFFSPYLFAYMYTHSLILEESICGHPVFLYRINEG